MLQPVIPDPELALAGWRKRHGVRPMNHVVTLHRGLARARPWVAEEVMRLLKESAADAPAVPGADSIVFGVEAMRPALELIVRYAFQQGLIPRPFAVDELFDG